MAEVIDFEKMWESGRGRKSRHRGSRRSRRGRRGASGMSVEATPLKLNLDPKPFMERVGEAMVERFVQAVKSTRAKPKASTIKRRGPGALFNITGEFLRGVTYKLGSKGDAFIVDSEDRLGPGRLKYLFRRIREARHDRILQWLVRTGRLDDAVGEMFETGFSSKGTGIPKGRLGGLRRRR